MTEQEYIAQLDCLTLKEAELKRQKEELAAEYLQSIRKFKKGDKVSHVENTNCVGTIVVARLYGTVIQYTVRWSDGTATHWEKELISIHKYSITFEERVKQVQEQVKRLEEAKKVRPETMLTVINI